MLDDKKLPLPNKGILKEKRSSSRIGNLPVRKITVARRTNGKPNNLHKAQILPLKGLRISTEINPEVANVPKGGENQKRHLYKNIEANPVQTTSQLPAARTNVQIPQSESLVQKPVPRQGRADVKKERGECILLGSFEPEALLSTDETAEFLSLSPKTLANWRWQGKGPEFIKCGHSVRYEVREIQNFIKMSRRSSTSG